MSIDYYHGAEGYRMAYVFGSQVGVVNCVTVVRCLPSKENAENHSNAKEDSENPENPSPSQGHGNLPGEKGR